MDNPQKEKLNLDYFRRYGVELELNAFDLRNRPIGHENGKLPEGIHYIGNLVQKTVNENVLIHKWGNDHNNEQWVIKPDASCGMEVCTPVCKGWHDLKKVCKVIDGFALDPKVLVDERCSLHIHIEVADLSLEQVATILTWWIKCEPVFMDSVPRSRKRNRYCQFIGLADFMNEIEDGFMPMAALIRNLGEYKYYSANSYHIYRKKRSSVEFRIMDYSACKDSLVVKNWTRLLLHFVERCVARRMPENYEKNNSWSGYQWLDPIQVFEHLGFLPNQYELSEGLSQTRSWFLSKLLQNTLNANLPGVMSDKARFKAWQETVSLSSQVRHEIERTEEQIYSDNFRI